MFIYFHQHAIKFLLCGVILFPSCLHLWYFVIRVTKMHEHTIEHDPLLISTSSLIAAKILRDPNVSIDSTNTPPPNVTVDGYTVNIRVTAAPPCFRRGGYEVNFGYVHGEQKKLLDSRYVKVPDVSMVALEKSAVKG